MPRAGPFERSPDGGCASPTHAREPSIGKASRSGDGLTLQRKTTGVGPGRIPRWTGGDPVDMDKKLIKQCTITSVADDQPSHLDFTFKFLERVSGLHACGEHLQFLDLSSNNIRRLENFDDMLRLEVLKVCGCELRCIENLEHCTKLIELHLEDNLISSIQGLQSLRALEHLNLDTNRISSIGRGLAGLVKLREFHIAHNALSSLNGLTGLKALETLDASGNRLSVIPASQMHGLFKLDELKLAGNQLRAVEFLVSRDCSPVLPRLATLDLANNSLESAALEKFPRLLRLAELDLAGNQIQHLPDHFVTQMPAMEILDVSQNQLVDCKSLEQLAYAESLRELSLHGNPCTAVQQQGNESTHDGDGSNLCPSEGLVELLLAKLPSLLLLDDQPFQRSKSETGHNNTQDDLSSTFRLTAASLLKEPDATAQATRMQQRQHHQQPVPLSRVLKRAAAPVEKVEKWEQRVMGEFASIARNVEKTLQQSASDLQEMDNFIANCQRARDFGRPTKHSDAAACAALPVSRSQPSLLRRHKGEHPRIASAAISMASCVPELPHPSPSVASFCRQNQSENSEDTILQCRSETRAVGITAAAALHCPPLRPAIADLEEVVEEVEVGSPDLKQDAPEVEEEIEHPDDTSDVKDAKNRLRSVRAMRKRIKVCRLGDALPRRAGTQSSLQTPLPFPSF